MEYHESMAIIAYGLDRNINTSTWQITAIPADHLADFRAWCIQCCEYAQERLSEPDDPADQAWWHERVNEWRDILRTLKEQA